VVNNPSGIPIKMIVLIIEEFKSILIFDIENMLPKVSKGPNARNIVNSPKPFLADSLSGFAV
tara:strand:+ start:388 stop:573 length:186 start_codon:yes stop_codon:yes gene_type:complete